MNGVAANAFTQNMSQWLRPALMQDWKYEEQEQAKKQQQAMSQAIAELNIYKEKASEGAFNATQIWTEPQTQREGGTFQIEYEKETPMGQRVKQLGGKPMVDLLQETSRIKNIEMEETLAGKAAERMIKINDSATRIIEDAFKKKDKYGADYPIDLFDAQLKSAAMLQAKIGITVDISALDDWATAKDKIKVAEDQALNNTYKAFLNDPSPTTATALQTLIPSYKKKHDLPEGSLKVMEDALQEWQKTKFAKPNEPPYKKGQILPAERIDDKWVTKQVTGYDPNGMPVFAIIGESDIREPKPEVAAYKKGQILPAVREGDNWITRQVKDIDANGMPVFTIHAVSKIGTERETPAEAAALAKARTKATIKGRIESFTEEMKRPPTAEETRRMMINDPYGILEPGPGAPTPGGGGVAPAEGGSPGKSFMELKSDLMKHGYTAKQADEYIEKARKKGLLKDYSLLKNLGRAGDTELVQISPEEKKLLERRGGAGTINPRTGLREYYNVYDEYVKFFGGAEQYSNAIKAKRAAGTPLTDKGAAAAFESTYPQYFGYMDKPEDTVKPRQAGITQPAPAGIEAPGGLPGGFMPPNWGEATPAPLPPIPNFELPGGWWGKATPAPLPPIPNFELPGGWWGKATPVLLPETERYLYQQEMKAKGSAEDNYGLGMGRTKGFARTDWWNYLPKTY